MELVNNYLDNLKIKKNVLETTIKIYEGDLKRFLDFFSDKSILELTSTDIEDYISNLKLEYKEKSILRKLNTIKNFYKYLVLKKHIDQNPVEFSIKFEESSEDTSSELKIEDYNKILENFEDDFEGESSKIITILIAETGLEISDVLDIKIVELKRYEFKKIVGSRNNKIYSHDLNDNITEILMEFFRKYELSDLKDKENLFFSISRQKYRLKLIENIEKTDILYKVSPNMIKKIYKDRTEKIDYEEIKEEYFKIGIGDD